jgi:Ring finger domain
LLQISDAHSFSFCSAPLLYIFPTVYVQRVRAHCATCDEIQREFGSTPSQCEESNPRRRRPAIKLTTSYDTAETVLMDPNDEDNDGAVLDCSSSKSSDSSSKSRECPVCMECFCEDDIVSWSPCMGCDHVFHHECIKQWLLYHEGCPYCRITVLPVDREATDDITNPTQPANVNPQSNAIELSWRGLSLKQWTVAQLKLLAEQRTRRVLTTYYCLGEGLVTIAEAPQCSPDHVDCSKRTLLSMQRFVSTGVPQAKLAELRKTRQGCGEEIVVSVVPADVSSGVANGNESVISNDAHDRSTIELGARRNVGPAADAAIDVELCLSQLQVISRDGDMDGNEHDVSAAALR